MTSSGLDPADHQRRGGALEYLALVTGYRALVLVVAGVYALAYVLGRVRLLGDRELS